MQNLLLGTHEAILKGLFRIIIKTERSPLTFRRLPFMTCLNSLMKSQWLPPEEIERLQTGKLGKLLFHAYENVPYYRRVFTETGFHPGDFKGLEDLSGLPVLTKTVIQNHGSDLLSRTAVQGSYFRNNTGGSTGHPLTFFQSREFKAWAHAEIWRDYTMCGYRPGERMAFLWGSDHDSKAHRGIKNRMFNDLLQKNVVWINTFELTTSRLEQAAKSLYRFQPRLLVAYVSSATLLARIVRESGIKDVRPKAIQTSAELLTQPQRNLLEEVFKCPVYNRYGCREVGNIAHECETHDGLHLLAENNCTEFLVDDRPAKPGEVGAVTVTNLNNWAMPFIRYQPGDLGRPSSKKCSCGRGLPLMDVIDGRSSDYIVTPSGKFLYSGFFTRIFYKLAGIRQFQVIQKELDRLEVKIVPMIGFEGEASLKSIEEYVHNHGDPGLKVHFSLQEEILPSASGKFRYVFSEIRANVGKGA